MTLGSDVVAVLPELRAQAESMFRDTFTVLRKTGNKITDPVTLEEVDEYAVLIPAVKGKFKNGLGRGADAEIPGVVAVVSSMEWHTSISTTGVRLDDEIQCVAVDPNVGDPELVGVRVRVTGPIARSLATARRFPVEEVS